MKINILYILVLFIIISCKSLYKIESLKGSRLERCIKCEDRFVKKYDNLNQTDLVSTFKNKNTPSTIFFLDDSICEFRYKKLDPKITKTVKYKYNAVIYKRIPDIRMVNIKHSGEKISFILVDSLLLKEISEFEIKKNLLAIKFGRRGRKFILNEHIYKISGGSE